MLMFINKKMYICLIEYKLMWVYYICMLDLQQIRYSYCV